MLRALFILLSLLQACQKDETVSGHGGQGQVWTLAELDGAPFPAKATMRFPAAGQIAGTAPCSSYAGRQSAPYPWFEATAISVPKMACPKLAEETRFFTALKAMTLVETSGSTLILSNDDGGQMVFTARK